MPRMEAEFRFEHNYPCHYSNMRTKSKVFIFFSVITKFASDIFYIVIFGSLHYTRRPLMFGY